MKLTTTTFLSLDGVMQGIGAPDEDRRGDFERGGWATPYFDDESNAFLSAGYERADAYLFGRTTYEIFANSWGKMPESDHPIAVALNSKPKYVASTSLKMAEWGNTTVLSEDLVAAVRALKAKSDHELQVHGAASSSLGCSITTWSTR